MNISAPQYLIFCIQNDLYAFDLAGIAEIAEMPTTWPIPAAPSYYAGAMNFHGTIVAVMDLSAFMDIQPIMPPERLIVLNISCASLAFLVERIVRIVRQDETSPITEHNEGFSSGTFLLPEGKVTLLDPKRIVARAGETINI